MLALAATALHIQAQRGGAKGPASKGRGGAQPPVSINPQPAISGASTRPGIAPPTPGEGEIETQSPWKELPANPAETRKRFHLLFPGAGQQETGLLVPGRRLGDLLRNTRKTECGASLFLMPLAVRAAPFALLKARASRPLVGVSWGARVQRVA